jgi:elongation factor 1-gamma
MPTLIAAEYNGIDLIVNTTDLESAATNVSPVGKLPVLACSDGQAIFSSHSIARFIAGLRRDTGLLPAADLTAMAAVDAWMDYCAADLELPACMWWYPIAGYMQFSQPAYEKAKSDLAQGLAKLEAHLQKKANDTGTNAAPVFLVGNQLTLADIVLVTTLLYPFKLVADPEYRKPYPTVMQWFTHCVEQPEFAAIVGKVALCPKELPPPQK